MKILIADDMEENLYLLETLLKGNGYEVISAKNGVEALEKLKKEPVDMIISDILMPKMDGFRLCGKCKSDDKLKKIPFIFYTATYTDEKSESFALSLGAEKFITKPMEPKNFMKIIKDLLKKYEKGVSIPPKIPAKKKAANYLKGYDEILVKKLEKKMLDLQKSEYKYRTLVENLPQRISLRDKNSVYVSCNENFARDLKIKPDEIAGKTLDDFFPKKVAEKYRAHDKEIMESGETFEIDELDEVHTQNGRETWIHIVKTPVKDEKGNSVGVLSILWDVTERKNAEKAMREFIYKVNDISRGECYLHSSRDAAYRTFAQLVLHGVPGLCISREKPEKLIKYGVPKENIILMSSKPLKGFEVIEDLQGASRAISNFLKEHKTPVVLLDGLAYLTSRFNFSSVYKFIQEKRFAFVDADAVLLMPIDLATFSDKERALLTSEVNLLG